MTYSLYDTKIQTDEDVILDNIIDVTFPQDEDSYITINVRENQDLMEIARLIYGDVSQWKMLAILNKIEDPFKVLHKTILAIKPELLEEVGND